MPVENPPAVTTTTLAPGEAAPPVAQPPAPPAQTVTIPLEQLQVFTSVQARLAQMEADQRVREEASKAEHVKLLAQKGEIEQALLTQKSDLEKKIDAARTEKATLEERAKKYALDGELSRVLASQPLVPGAAGQLTELWRNKFQVEPQGDSFNVRTPDFQSVSDFVSSSLGRPEYAHFIRAQNPGGGTAGTTGGHQAAPTPPAPTNPIAPKNFGEAIILQMQELAKTQPSDSRLNPAVAMGLNRASIIRQA